MPQLPQLFRWASEKPRFAIQTGSTWHVVSNPEEVFKQYGDVNIASLPVAQTGGVSASDMALQDILKISAQRTGEQDIASKYEALQAKFGSQIPTSEYEKVFPPSRPAPISAPVTPTTQQYGQILTLPNGQRISPLDPNYSTYAKQLGVSTTPAGQFGTTPTGERIDESDPRVQALMAQGLNPDVAIGNVIMSLGKGGAIPQVEGKALPQVEPEGIISSTNDPYQMAVNDALKANQQAIASLTSPTPQLPGAPGITVPAVPELPDVSKIGEIKPLEISPETSPEIQAVELRRKQLESERVAATLDIENRFEQQRRETEEVQRGNLEFFKAQAAGLGILPQNSTQYTQYLTDSINRNQRALLDIVNAETRVINEANRAYSQGDFDLLDRKLATMSKMRSDATELARYNTDLEFKKSSLALDMAKFQTDVGFSAAALSLQEMEYGLARTRELREAGISQFEIGLRVKQELRESKMADIKYTQDLADNLALSLIDSGIDEIKEASEDYGVDVNVLLSSITKQRQAVSKEEREFGLGEQKLALDYKLSQQKFDEDKRQFGITTALKQRELDIAAVKASGTKDGARSLKDNALTSAQDLLTKFNQGKGTSVVGKFGKAASLVSFVLGGTEAENFKVQFKNLKSLLSLDNVSYLKGQGQVSDAERKLLSEASAKLELSQSESEFKDALEDIVVGLGGVAGKESVFTGLKGIYNLPY